MHRILRCVAIGIVLAVAPAAESAERLPPLGPMDIFDLQHASTPQISPDGQRIVYVREFFDLMNDRKYSNLWLVNTNGEYHRSLTTGKFRDYSPKWSPDGKRLAWISNRDGAPQIFVRSADGTSRAVTELQEPPSSLAWSPDGSQISFLKRVPEAPLVIGTPPTPPPGANWAPPPKYTDKLVFRFDAHDGIGEVPPGHVHLFVVAADGGPVRQLTGGAFNDEGTAFSRSGYDWAPDGKSIVFTARRFPDADRELLQSDLFEVTLADGLVRQLTDRFGPDAAPVMSPDGKLIAYTGFTDRRQGYQNTLVHIMNRDSGDTRVLAGDADISVGAVVWSPDSKALFVTYDREGVTRIALMELDGSFRDVARDLGSGQRAYGRHFISVARNGGVAFTVATPHLAGDVAVVRPGATQRTLTALNAGLFSSRELGKVEEIWWNSSKDRRRIQGWIVKPPGFEPSRKYPLIVEMHGGPFAGYGPRFDLEKQLMAAPGYVVFYPNPRGSTGYGEDFANAIHHAFPGDDRFDVDSGIDAVIAKGYVDHENLFVTGGSYGGVLTAWLIGHSDRFRAAVAFYPVINWESWTLTADVAPIGVNSWFPTVPWENRDAYDDRSLLHTVGNVRTPTLIMTGEEDYRTPMSESEQYYKALKLQGKEAVLVRVPGEAHGIWGRPSNAIRKMTTLHGWFDRYRTNLSTAP